MKSYTIVLERHTFGKKPRCYTRRISVEASHLQEALEKAEAALLPGEEVSYPLEGLAY